MNKKILLLDDNPLHRGLLGDELEDSNFMVARASSVEEARNLAQDFNPDIFVLDLVIRDDHLGVIEWVEDLRLGERYRSTPILFVTAYSPEFRERVKEVKRAALLDKPFTIQEVVRDIRALLAGREVG